MRKKVKPHLLLMLIWLVSCQRSPAPNVQEPAITQTTSLQSPTVTATPLLEVLATSLPIQTTQSPATMPVAFDETWPFDIPIQTTAPPTGWRPPMYPLPWAPTPYDHFLFIRPIAANENYWILANYRYGGVFFTGVVHTGIDIPVKTGAEVFAAGPGRVSWVGYGLLSAEYNPDDPYGLAIVIRHDFGYQGQTLYTVYGHLSSVGVTLGQHVETGDLLGLSGATGHVTGPHLHFEVRIGRNSFSRSRNPELWISPPQGWGILAGRITDSFGENLTSKEVLIRSLETGQKYTVRSYGAGSVNSDPYYNENVVIGDLPAGKYSIWLLDETSDHAELEIYPGRVSYFSFRRGLGFDTRLPPAPRNGFATPVIETTPTP